MNVMIQIMVIEVGTENEFVLFLCQVRFGSGYCMIQIMLVFSLLVASFHKRFEYVSSSIKKKKLKNQIFVQCVLV